MKRVVIESPLSGDRELHKFYARVCALDCLVRGESPYASHLFFDHEDLLDDTIPEHRQLGIRAGFAWATRGELRVFYLDLGESSGMKIGREHAAAHNQATEDRRLYNVATYFSELSKDGKLALLRASQAYYLEKILR